jgi:hypothetical protein
VMATHCVWYASAGCLPDSEAPEFEGTFGECLTWVEANRHDYDTSVLYGLHVEPLGY